MNKIFFFLLFIISINSAYADFDLASLKIGDKEPINEPIDSYDPNKNSYPDPFGEDEILFTIDKNNYHEYADQLLTPGQIEMFETYPETFKMHVYQSRRSCAVPEEVILLTTQNAELTDKGEGLIGVVGSIPFPNPSEALHHVWNHILRYRGVNIYGSSPFYIINPDNSITYGAGEAIAINYWNLPLHATLKDVVRVIRDDEAGHRDVNHKFADLINLKRSKLAYKKNKAREKSVEEKSAEEILN